MDSRPHTSQLPSRIATAQSHSQQQAHSHSSQFVYSPTQPQSNLNSFPNSPTPASRPFTSSASFNTSAALRASQRIQNSLLHPTNEIGLPTKQTCIMPDVLSNFLDQKPSFSLSAVTRSQTATGTRPVFNSQTGTFILEPNLVMKPDRFRMDNRVIVTSDLPPENIDNEKNNTMQCKQMMTPSELANHMKDAIIKADQFVQEGVYHTYQDAQFSLGQVRPPQVKTAPLDINPELIKKANETYLLTPYERRKIAEYEKQQQILRHELNKESQVQTKLKDAMIHNYPRGVKNFDSPAVLDSLVYAEQAIKLREAQLRKEAHQQARTQNIAHHTASSTIAPDLKPSQPRDSLIFDRKLRASGCPDALEDSHERLFVRPLKEMKADPARVQRLRDVNTQGRTYDLISGAPINTIRPSIPEKINVRQSHPSMTLHSVFR